MESPNKFLGFIDRKKKGVECLILYRDEFCAKVKKRKIKTDKGEKTVAIKLKSREISVPVLRQTFYATEWGSEPLPTVWREIHRYVESLMGKKYKNDETFVTTAPMEENRTEIVYKRPLPLGGFV